MTTARKPGHEIGEPQDFFVFPDPPEIPEEKMTNFEHLAANGNVHHLAIHLGNPETTLVIGERYVALAPTRNLAGIRYPDLLVAFDVDPEAYHRRRAYVIADQGKPPDFVMEIASPSTGRIDAGEKRNDYAALGIAEYWRFDEDGRYHGARLAGDRLVAGRYEPIPIREIAEDVLEGYSSVLNLHLRWEREQLGWYDPATGRHIVTFEDERAARMDAEAETHAERAARMDAEAELRAERAARAAAESRISELEERLGQGGS